MLHVLGWAALASSPLLALLFAVRAWERAASTMDVLGILSVTMLLGGPGLAALVGLVLRLRVLARAHRWAERTGFVGLAVISDSPAWSRRIQERWRPRLGRRVSVLNWSERRRWPDGVERALHREFGGGRDHCPLILVLRGWREPAVYRFHRAFKKARPEDRRRVDDYEERALAAVEQAAAGTGEAGEEPGA